jgi:uncharacterized membrane protein
MGTTHATSRAGSGAAPGRTGPPKLPAFVLGIGMGGFVDGIVLHQVFQWHHMLTDTGDHPADTVAGLEANTLADGLFHAGTWVLVAVGLLLTVDAWQRGRLAPPWRSHVGLWLHHVRDDLGGPLSWDIGFLVLGAVLVAGGLGLARVAEAQT